MHSTTIFTPTTAPRRNRSAQTDYVFGNGICVGDSEEKVKQAFGPPSEFEETEFKDFLIYEALGLSFEINKQDRSVMETARIMNRRRASYVSRIV
jgi:hypothetical protein